MRIIALDDEELALEGLMDVILEAVPEAELHGFLYAEDVLEFIKENSCDVAFLDVEMAGLNGIGLAEQLQLRNPDVNIIFATGFSDYLGDAFDLHASGYIIKPVTSAKVKKELEDLRRPIPENKRIRVKAFGYFEVSFQGQPLRFKRSKTKELLAFLVECNGSGVTTKQICSKLWAEDSDDVKNANYLYQLFDDLRSTLRGLQMEEVLLRSGFSYAIDPKKLDCDYYDFLQTGNPPFLGEYMTQYSWAEETCGRLSKK